MKLIDLYDNRHCYVGNDGEYERWNIDPEVPTIDAVEVVRCKGCKHWWPSEEICDRKRTITSGMWFCADGERRGEEDG